MTASMRLGEAPESFSFSTWGGEGGGGRWGEKVGREGGKREKGRKMKL
jgi:hypothetical protein